MALAFGELVPIPRPVEVRRICSALFVPAPNTKAEVKEPVLGAPSTTEVIEPVVTKLVPSLPSKYTPPIESPLLREVCVPIVPFLDFPR